MAVILGFIVGLVGLIIHPDIAWGDYYDEEYQFIKTKMQREERQLHEVINETRIADGVDTGDRQKALYLRLLELDDYPQTQHYALKTTMGSPPSEMDFSSSTISAVEDGEGGGLIFWRFTITTEESVLEGIAGQHIDANGQRLWNNRDPIVIAASDSQVLHIGEPAVISDGNGGAIVVYETKFMSGENAGMGFITGDRINARGEVIWSTVILHPITANIIGRCLFNPAIVSDGANGAIVVAELGFTEDEPAQAIIGQRVDEKGTLLWEELTISGVPVNMFTHVLSPLFSTNPAVFGKPALIGDGDGGVIVIAAGKIVDGILKDTEFVLGQRVDRYGHRLWNNDNPQFIFSAPAEFHLHNPVIVKSFQGAIIMAELAVISGEYAGVEFIVGTRVNPNGSFMWTDPMLFILGGDSLSHLSVSDTGEGCMAIAEKTTGDGKTIIVGQRVDETGSLRWEIDGKDIFELPNKTVHNPAIKSDSTGHVIVVAEVEQTGEESSGKNTDIVGRWMDAEGEEGALFFPFALSSSDNLHTPVIASSGQDTVIITAIAGGQTLLGQGVNRQGELLWNKGRPVHVYGKVRLQTDYGETPVVIPSGGSVQVTITAVGFVEGDSISWKVERTGGEAHLAVSGQPGMAFTTVESSIELIASGNGSATVLITASTERDKAPSLTLEFEGQVPDEPTSGLVDEPEEVVADSLRGNIDSLPDSLGEEVDRQDAIRSTGIWTTYLKVDGLIGEEVHSITQSVDGSMWFATVGGVSRYDGTWQSFGPHEGLVNGWVLSAIQSADGAMWFGTQGGVSRYDGGTWQSFTVQDGLVDDWVQCILQTRDGAMWFGTKGGVSRYDGIIWQAVEGVVSQNVRSIYQSVDGGLWFGTREGVSQYDGMAWKTYTIQDGLPSNDVYVVYQSADGSMWFGTAAVGNIATGVETGGVTKYDGKTWQTFTSKEGLADNWVYAIFQSSDGAMWFGGKGVSRYDDTWKKLTTHEGLADNWVESIFQSTDGVMWFGTRRGLSRYSGENWQTYTTKDGLVDDWILSIYQSNDGAMWFGTVNGLSRFDGTHWQTFTERNGLIDNTVSSIYQSSDGVMWFGSDDGQEAFYFGNGRGGVSRYDGKEWQTFTIADSLSDNMVHCVFQSSDGMMWFGTDRGANRYDGTKIAIETGLHYSPLWPVYSIYQSSDRVMWYGGAGLNRYDGNWTFYEPKDGLADNRVTSILQAADGAMWFGTFAGGVSRYDGTWQTFRTEDGLADNKVTSIFQSREGTMWFGTHFGVSYFQRQLPLVQTMILNPPPVIFGDSRFYFECRGYEIGYDGLPPLSAALARRGEQPRISDWSPFRVVNGYEQTGLVNGSWTFHVRAKDRYGNVDPTPATVTFTVDLTPPTVGISIPRKDDPISGEVVIMGLAVDRSSTADLVEYLLEYGAGNNVDQVEVWTIIDKPHSSPVENSVLGTWYTQDLPDGNYMLRIRARDRLGHTSDHAINVVLVSALEQLRESQGGHVTSVRGTVDLMVPPNGIQNGGQIQISHVPMDGLPPSPSGTMATDAVYRIGPDELIFQKRATLKIGFEPEHQAGMKEADLAVFTLSGAEWTRLGGTVDTTTHAISVAISAPGTYALFEAPWADGSTRISSMGCQPRVISPAGGMYPPTTDISFELGSRSQVDARVYSVSGNLVCEIAKEVMLNAGWNTLHWDGRDRHGEVVASGLYVIVVETEGKASNLIMAVLNR